ncbi:hypothetical protein [Nocardia sp. NPDC051750]|uniref:hypothetical protein n=1 Tax=Nocardia sp. NPDC051750 TaxID=3364325 RepID=UPI00378C5055
MSGSDEKGPSQVELIGPVAGVITYVIAAGLILTGPVIALTASPADALCPGIITFPIGMALAVQTFEWRGTERRFRAVGLLATAEITAVRIRQGGESPDVAELRVRISGPGVDPFTSDCEVPSVAPRPQVGDRLRVVVDPADNSFAIGYDHLFEPD